MNLIEVVVLNAFYLPMFVLNIRLYYILRTRWQTFNSSFYRIVCINVFIDLLNFLTIQYTWYLPNIEPAYDLFLYRFETFSYWNTGVFFANYFLLYASQLGILILALNRLTSFLFKFSYNQLWERYIRYVLAAYIIIPFMCTSHLLLNRTSIIQQETIYGTYRTFQYELKYAFGINLAVRSFIYCAITMGISLALNIGNICLIFYYRAQLKLSQDGRFKFAMFSIIMFSAHFCLVVNTAIYQHGVATENVPLRWFMVIHMIPASMAFSSLMPGTLLVLTSSFVRTHVIGNTRHSQSAHSGPVVTVVLPVRRYAAPPNAKFSVVQK